MKKNTLGCLLIFAITEVVLIFGCCASFILINGVFWPTLGFRGTPLTYKPIALGEKVDDIDYTFKIVATTNPLNKIQGNTLILANSKQKFEIASTDLDISTNPIGKYSIINHNGSKFILIDIGIDSDFADCSGDHCSDSILVYKLLPNSITQILPTENFFSGTCLDPVLENDKIIALRCNSEDIISPPIALIEPGDQQFITFDLK